MDDFTHEDLSIRRADAAEPQCARYVWHGRSNARNPSQVLQPFFASILAQASASGQRVEMDFTTLEHFNSSTITALIQLIQDCRSKGLRLRLRYDDKVKWQKLSFGALRVFVKPAGLLELLTS